MPLWRRLAILANLAHNFMKNFTKNLHDFYLKIIEQMKNTAQIVMSSLWRRPIIVASLVHN